MASSYDKAVLTLSLGALGWWIADKLDCNPVVRGLVAVGSASLGALTFATPSEPVLGNPIPGWESGKPHHATKTLVNPDVLELLEDVKAPIHQRVGEVAVGIAPEDAYRLELLTP